MARPAGSKTRKPTFAVEFATERLGWAFLCRHKSLQKASDWIRRQAKQDKSIRYYRILEDRHRPNQTKVDRYFIPYILLPKPRKPPKPRSEYKPRKYRYKPNRFDVMWRAFGGEWKLDQTFKKRKKALAYLESLEEGWIGTGIEGKIHYRREDLSGRTYYEEGIGFI